MSIADDALAGLQANCQGARLTSEAGKDYVYFPALKVPVNGEIKSMEALLCPGEHSGYATRLFLAQPIPGKGQNWTVHTIIGRSWHTWSWKDVPASLPPTQILLAHLAVLR